MSAKIIYGFDDLGNKVPIGKYGQDTSKPVGGRIFYIDSTADGIYTFYDKRGLPISAPTVGTDCTGWTYDVEGATKDKFYVYDNTTGLIDTRAWGYYEITTGASTNTIGSGKTNTATILEVTDTSEYANSSIFYYLSSIQNVGTGVNGCNDWYIGSMEEINALRTSGLETWFSNYYIWSSVENSVNFSWGWDCGESHQYWKIYYRYNNSLCRCCFFRSF